MSRIYKKTNFAGSDSLTGIAFGGGGGGGRGGRNTSAQSRRDMQYAAASGCVTGGIEGGTTGFALGGPAGAALGGGLGCLGGATAGVLGNEVHTRVKDAVFGKDDY